MLISIQALRALAAWMVVCHHFMQVFFDFNASGPLGQFFSTRGAVGVDIFFVISGLVIYLSTYGKPQAPQRFLLNRLLRIVPAYWFYTLLMALLLAGAGAYMPHGEVSWPTFLLSLLFVPSENPGGYGLYPTLNVGWTLNYEMFFYLVFSLVFWVPPRWRLALVVAVLLLVVQGMTHLGQFSRFYGNGLLYEFLFGIAIGIAWRRGWVRPARAWPLAMVLCSGLAIYLNGPDNRLLHWGLPSAMLVLGCLALEPWFKGKHWLKALGDRSYSVYLIHLLVLYAGFYLYRQYGLNPYLVFFGLCLPTIALASIASYELLEKRLYRALKGAVAPPPAAEGAGRLLT